MAKKKNVSIYISFLLRHKPDEIDLNMDKQGWVSVRELIDGINNSGKYTITFEQLKQIVAEDNKGRYRFNEDKSQIKACQGHSIPWVEPEMEYIEPPEFLYHGTTTVAFEKIKKSGAVLKMSRHAVHMQDDLDKAWQSACRWKIEPVVLQIAAKELFQTGVMFGKTENGVWCTEQVPIEYIAKVLYKG